MKTQRLHSYPLVVIITFIIGILAASEAKAEANSNQKIMNELLARVQIQELISSSLYLFDLKDDRFVDLYTEDAVWEYWPPGSTASLFSLNSREQLRSWAKRRWENETKNIKGRHYQTDHVFLKLTKTYARVRTLLLIVHMKDTASVPFISRIGTLEDEFRKTSDGWRISHRIVRTDNF